MSHRRRTEKYTSILANAESIRRTLVQHEKLTQDPVWIGSKVNDGVSALTTVGLAQSVIPGRKYRYTGSSGDSQEVTIKAFCKGPTEASTDELLKQQLPTLENVSTDGITPPRYVLLSSEEYDDITLPISVFINKDDFTPVSSGGGRKSNRRKSNRRKSNRRKSNRRKSSIKRRRR